MRSVKFSETVAPQWLREQLKDGPVSSQEMKRLAARDGISRRALYGGAKAAGVVCMRVGQRAVWLLDEVPEPVAEPTTEPVAPVAPRVETAVLVAPRVEPAPAPQPPVPVQPEGARLAESTAAMLRLPASLPSRGLLSIGRANTCSACGSPSSFAWGSTVLCARCARQEAA